MASGPGALASFAVPQGAEQKTSRLVTIGVVAALVLAAGCLPLAIGALLGDRPSYAVGILAALGFWLLVAGGIAWWGRRVRGRPQTTGGTVLAAVLPDGVYMGGGLVLPWPAIAEIGLFWFAIPVRGRALPGAGRAIGTAMIDAANEAAGGNLGLAVVVRPHDPALLQVPATAGTVPVEVRQDPARHPVALVKGHRLVIDGDPVAFAAALAESADRAGVPVGGLRRPPADPPELPGWLT